MNSSGIRRCNASRTEWSGTKGVCGSSPCTILCHKHPTNLDDRLLEKTQVNDVDGGGGGVGRGEGRDKVMEVLRGTLNSNQRADALCTAGSLSQYDWQ